MENKSTCHMTNEKRLIDANALLQSEVKRCGCIPSIGSGYNNETSFRLILEQAPTVDAVEVVRCLHCQYAKPYERVDGLTGYYCQYPKNTVQYGTNWERLFEPIKEAWNYCSYGERREGE